MSYCAHCGAEVDRVAASCAACGKPPRSHPRRVAAAAARDPLTVTMLVVGGGVALVAVIGIFAAILIPNLLDAAQKAKQKRTVADMRTVGTGWMSWLTDEMSAVAAGAATTYDFAALEQALTAAELERQLRADPEGRPYVEDVPDLDGWGHAFEFRQAADLLARHVMAIRSPGRDGVFTGTAYSGGAFGAREYDEDLVWADGYFLRAPGGVGPRTGVGD